MKTKKISKEKKKNQVTIKQRLVVAKKSKVLAKF